MLWELSLNASLSASRFLHQHSIHHMDNPSIGTVTIKRMNQDISTNIDMEFVIAITIRWYGNGLPQLLDSFQTRHRIKKKSLRTWRSVENSSEGSVLLMGPRSARVDTAESTARLTPLLSLFLLTLRDPSTEFHAVYVQGSGNPPCRTQTTQRSSRTNHSLWTCMTKMTMREISGSNQD